MTEPTIDPNEQDQHDTVGDGLPAKKHGDALEEVVTDDVPMHDEQ
jgi:hypothetical protein